MMEAQEALVNSPVYSAKYRGEGYCLAILNYAAGYLDLTLDEDEAITQWSYACIADLETINYLAQTQHPDFDRSRWEPIQDMEEIRQYNKPPKKRAARRKRGCKLTDERLA